MRPINLLPPYIYDKQKKTQLAAFWGVGVLAVAAGFIYWQSLIQQDLNRALEEKQTAEQFQVQYNTLNQQITQENNNIAAIKQKQDFIANAQKYNDSWRNVYLLMRDVTSPRVILRSMAVDPSTRRAISFAGSARTEMDIVRWWMAMRNDTTRFDSVRFELPPHPYAPNSGTAGLSGMGGAGRYPALGGYGAPGSGGGPMQAGINLTGPGGGGAPSGFSGGPGGAGRPPMGMPPGMGPGGPGSFGGGSPFAGGGARGFGGGGGQSGNIGPDMLEGRPVINFTGVAVLNKPLADGIPTPSWPPGAAGTGTGGFGGPGGFGGGRPPMGMPPGMGPGGPGSFGGGSRPPGMPPGMGPGGPSSSGSIGGGSK